MKRRPLRPGNPPRRRTPLRPANPERRERRRGRDFGAHAERVRGMPCMLTGHPAPSHPHHVRSRGAGGTWWHIIPVSPRMHQRLHTEGERALPGRWTRRLLLQAAIIMAWESYDEGVVNEPPGEPRPERRSMQKTKDHHPSCPRAQAWDPGEWVVPCKCPPGWPRIATDYQGEE